MISYKPLWELMDAKDMTTYTLRNMGKEYCLSGSTIARLQAAESGVSQRLCKPLN